MTPERLQAERVTNPTDYGQGYSETQFGFCIGGRVFWCGIEGYGHDQEQADKSKALCMEIIRRFNAAPAPSKTPEPVIRDSRTTERVEPTDEEWKSAWYKTNGRFTVTEGLKRAIGTSREAYRLAANRDEAGT